MNEFTLFKALNILKRHLPVTIALFLVTYWVLPSLNILENKYSVDKIIKVGEHHEGFKMKLLNFESINGILISPNLRLQLQKTIGESGLSSFKITENDVGNMVLTFKSNNLDSIVNTAKAVMQRLQEFDKKSIQKKIVEINAMLDIDREVLEMLKRSMDDFLFSDEDIEQYAALQKKYDQVAENDIKVDEKYTAQVFNLMRFKLDDTTRRVNSSKQILNQKKKINELELIMKEDFTTVSYLFPVSKNEISIYYPNPMIFFGLSLLVAFFYNLILLSYKYRESVK